MSSLEKRSFKSIKGRTSEYKPVKKFTSDSVDQIVTKDGEELLKIDIKKIESTLRKLRQNSDKEILSLKGKTHEQFKQIVTYIFLLYDTPAYKTFYDLIGKHFSDLENIKPGTIGAYFGGCRVDTNFSNMEVHDYTNSCSVICAGSVPNPKESFCGHLVIWAVYKNDEFEFVELNKNSENSEQEYDSNEVFVFTNHTSLDSFPGFTDREKTKLKNLGVEKIKLFGYENERENVEKKEEEGEEGEGTKGGEEEEKGVKDEGKREGRTYVNIGKDEYMPLEDIKSRLQVVESKGGVGEDFTDYTEDYTEDYKDELTSDGDSNVSDDTNDNVLKSASNELTDDVKKENGNGYKNGIETADVKERNTRGNKKSSTALYVILLIILVTLILFFAWKSRKDV